MKERAGCVCLTSLCNTFSGMVTGEITRYAYGHQTVPTITTYADGTTTEIRYDERENRIYERNRNGDGTIRRLEVGGSLVTEYAYDVDKNLIGQKIVMMGLEGGDNPLGTLQGLGNQAFPAPNPLKSAVLVDNTYTYKIWVSGTRKTALFLKQR